MSNSSEQTRRYGSLFFIAALAILFALQWGPGSQGCDTRIASAESAATVNGKPIPLKDFALYYARQAENYRRQGVPPDMMKQLGLHKQAIDSLVSGELLSQAAEARGLNVSDEEVAKALRRTFEVEGKFNKEWYLDHVHQVERTTEAAFGQKMRRQLAAQKLLELVESSVWVSEEEVKAKYLKEGDVAKVTFVRFSPAMFSEKVVPPKRGEVDTWLKANEAAVSAYYEQNKFTYMLPEKVKAKQILLRVPADANEAQKAEIKQRAENVRKDIVENKKDFSEIAKAVSDDVETREKGGDLGAVERLQLPGAFADVLFALKPGEVTTPVETPLGWFIGTALEKQAPEQRPLSEVKAEIAGQLLVKEKARAIARMEAEKALAEVKKGKELSKLFPADKTAFAAETKPAAKETGPFNSFVEDIPQLGHEPSLKKRIFDLKAPGTLEEVLSVGETFIIAVVDERKLTSDSDFEAQKAQLRIEAIKARQFEVREGFLKSLKQVGTVVTNDLAIDKVLAEG